MRVALQTGSLFHDRFMIVKQLGIGGMGSVYLAEQVEARRKVALKIMHADFSDSTEERQDRFMREFQVLSKLQHANIVTFYSAAITPEGTQYAICEYIIGKSLQAVLAEDKRLSWSRVAKIGSQVCDAMIYAHANSVVHRDLKPANIMLLNHPEPDTVKVIDFGLAKITSGDLIQKLTQTGEIVGSPHYMSPEQILGHKVDARSDMYALACIIFECLSGKRLFDDDTAISIIRRHVQEDPLKMMEREFSIKEKLLYSCLTRALSKEPDARFENIAEFKENFLELCAAHEAGDLAEVSGKEFTQSRLPALLIFLILGSALIASAFWFAGLNRQESAPAIRSKAALNASPRKRNLPITKLENAVARLEQALSKETDRERQKEIYDELKVTIKKLWSAQSKLGLYDEEIASLKGFLKFASVAEDPDLVKADVLENIAKSQMDQGNFAESEFSLSQAEKILDKKGRVALPLKARWHCAHARLQAITHRFAEAKSSFLKARAEWQNLGASTEIPAVFFNDESVALLSHQKRFPKSKLDDFEISRASKILISASTIGPNNDAERMQYCQLLNALTEFFLANLAQKDAQTSLNKTLIELHKLPASTAGYKDVQAKYLELVKQNDTQNSDPD